MNTHVMMTLLSLSAILSAGPPARVAGTTGNEGTLQHFQQAVEIYAQLHRRLERQVPPLLTGSSPREIVASSDALAAAVRRARTAAREGDLFSPAEADAFRVLIARALYTHHYTAEEMIAAGADEAPAQAAHISVNSRFPWAYGAAMWPCVLLALPPLPEELQYRIVGRDLVLVDVHANLVIDILRDAVLPAS